MNMNRIPSRLDDRLNGLLIAAVVAGVVAINVSAIRDAAVDSRSAAVQTAVVDYRHLVAVVLAAL
jgi:hypothetical protein